MNLMESIFDIAYLGVIIGLGLRLILENNKESKIFGVMAIVLGFGDAFHLLPRVISNLTVNGFKKYASILSWGQFVTSITMTIFYILLYRYYSNLSKDKNTYKKIAIYCLAIIRIIIVLLPQNQWGTQGNYILEIVRNIPFVIMGLLLIIWTWEYRRVDGLKNISILISASFLFYLPVVVGARFIPVLGAFMIPKTIVYVLIVVVGYRHFIKDFKADNIIKTSITFVILGMIGGVFYREFTKIFAWTKYTSLGVVHVHLIVLGSIFFMIIYSILNNQYKNIKIMKKSIIFYIIGVSWTTITFVVRGIYTITSRGDVLFPNAMLSGIAGIGHTLLSIGILWIMINIMRISNLEGGKTN